MRQLDMEHLRIMKAAIEKHGYTRYLEIGVKEGVTFYNVPIRKKVGVEPELLFNLALNNVIQREMAMMKCIPLPDVTIHNMVSDEFYRANNKTEIFDMIYVDGLHTAEQSHRDIMNGLDILAPGGVIFVHDTNPLNELVANPGAPVVADWSGDVWKAILKIRCERNDLEVATADVQFGFTIIKIAKEIQPLLPEACGGMEYKEFSKRKNEVLNLVSVEEAIKRI